MVQLDIPMPKACYECPCHDGENNSCQVTGKYCYDEILRSCPLIELPSAKPDYTELKQEFIRMASYIDVLLECSDEQKEILIGFISRLSEYMPWTERD